MCSTVAAPRSRRGARRVHDVCAFQAFRPSGFQTFGLHRFPHGGALAHEIEVGAQGREVFEGRGGAGER